MSAAVVVKRLAAILLLVAFFLPLSQCTLETEHPETKAVERTVTVTYAYTAYGWPSLEKVAAYAAFLWPLLLAVASLIWPSLKQKLTVGALEIVLCLGSAFMLYGLTALGELRYGAYVAGGSIGLYFSTAALELAVRVRKRWARRVAAPAPH